MVVQEMGKLLICEAHLIFPVVGLLIMGADVETLLVHLRNNVIPT